MRGSRKMGARLTALATPAVALLLSGCFLVFEKGLSSLEGRYAVEVAPNWVEVTAGGADNSWRQEQSGAIIYTDSNCEHHFEDSPLDRLVEAQASALENRELLSKSELRLVGRAALTSRHRGLLDGVLVSLTTTVVKRSSCVYDFVMIGPPELEQGDIDAYEQLLASFRVEL